MAWDYLPNNNIAATMNYDLRTMNHKLFCHEP